MLLSPSSSKPFGSDLLLTDTICDSSTLFVSEDDGGVRVRLDFASRAAMLATLVSLGEREAIDMRPPEPTAGLLAATNVIGDAGLDGGDIGTTPLDDGGGDTTTLIGCEYGICDDELGIGDDDEPTPKLLPGSLTSAELIKDLFCRLLKKVLLSQIGEHIGGWLSGELTASVSQLVPAAVVYKM